MCLLHQRKQRKDRTLGFFNALVHVPAFSSAHSPQPTPHCSWLDRKGGVLLRRPLAATHRMAHPGLPLAALLAPWRCVHAMPSSWQALGVFLAGNAVVATAISCLRARTAPGATRALLSAPLAWVLLASFAVSCWRWQARGGGARSGRQPQAALPPSSPRTGARHSETAEPRCASRARAPRSSLTTMPKSRSAPSSSSRAPGWARARCRAREGCAALSVCWRPGSCPSHRALRPWGSAACQHVLRALTRPACSCPQCSVLPPHPLL